MTLVLDEFCPADAESLVYISENMLKVLLCPSIMGTMRARNNEIKLCEGVARIITANASPPANWVGHKMTWTDPLRRKSVAFMINKPLCDPSWVAEMASGANNANPSAEGASRIMQERLANAGISLPPTPEVVSAFSRICPRRRRGD